jgi:hypothetical protein
MKELLVSIATVLSVSRQTPSQLRGKHPPQKLLAETVLDAATLKEMLGKNF